MFTRTELPLHAAIVGGIMAMLVVLFVALFLFPAIRQWIKLRRYARRLEKADTKNLEVLSDLFKSDKTLKHLWKNFGILSMSNEI